MPHETRSQLIGYRESKWLSHNQGRVSLTQFSFQINLFAIFKFPIITSICFPHKFSIKYCCKMIALGNMNTSQMHFTTITYAQFWEQIECITGNWKTENIYSFGKFKWKIMAIPSSIDSSIQGEERFYFLLQSDVDFQRSTFALQELCELSRTHSRSSNWDVVARSLTKGKEHWAKNNIQWTLCATQP